MYGGAYGRYAAGGDIPRSSTLQAQAQSSMGGGGNLQSPLATLGSNMQQSLPSSLASQQAPPLLLNNLAQHLNNPPPPTPGVPSTPSGAQQSHQLSAAVAQMGNSGTPFPVSTGKLLLLPNGNPPPADSEEDKIYQLITELLDPETRETALLELSKKREMYEDLALVLWGGFGECSSGVVSGCRLATRVAVDLS